MGDYNDAMMRNKDPAVQSRTKARNRASILRLKLIGQSHPTSLTSNLLKHLEPRPPLEYKPPPKKRKCPPYTGLAQFVSNFAETGDPEYAPPVQKAETKAQKRARIHKIRLENGAIKAAEELQKCNYESREKIIPLMIQIYQGTLTRHYLLQSLIMRQRNTGLKGSEAYGLIKRHIEALIEMLVSGKSNGPTKGMEERKRILQTHNTACISAQSYLLSGLIS